MTCPKGALPVPIDMALRTRAKALYEAGETFSGIEAETGIKSATLRSWARRDGWTRASESELVIVEQPQEVDYPEDLASQAEEYESNLRRAAVTFSRFIADLPGETITAKSQHIKNVDSTARKALRIETEQKVPLIQIGILASSPAKADAARLYSTVRPIEAEQLTE